MVDCDNCFLSSADTFFLMENTEMRCTTVYTILPVLLRRWKTLEVELVKTGFGFLLAFRAAFAAQWGGGRVCVP